MYCYVEVHDRDGSVLFRSVLAVALLVNLVLVLVLPKYDGLDTKLLLCSWTVFYDELNSHN